MQIYQNVAIRCKEMRMTISELERSAGLGNATIAGWKTAFPRIDKLAAVASVLGCSIDDLIADPATEDTGAALPAC